MTDSNITLQVAAFLDSEESSLPATSRRQTQEIAERFLQCCYRDAGKAPHLLEGDDVAAILGRFLPLHFGKREPLAQFVPEVLLAYVDFLEGQETVVHSFEIRQALAANFAAFQTAVQAGLAGPGSHPAPRPIVERGERVGRNEPCPCGSGKKFKRCCAHLGDR
jgi:hypothetical protein